MTNERVERRLAAVLAADVVGYSRLMSVDEEGTLSTLKAVRRESVDPKITEYGGRIVKTTGDGLLVEFPSVVQAMRCAVDVQEVMRERNRPLLESRQIAFRIGITLGDVIVENGDIFGDGVNIAARLEQIASPGGITISHRVYEDVRDRLSIELEDGGQQQLKNISRPVQVWHWTGRPAATVKKASATSDFDWTSQMIRYCRTPDGVRLAYASIGDGPALVRAGGFLSHLEYDFNVWGPSYLKFGTGRKFIRYDARGNGLSDWEVKDLSPEAWVMDLETVVDAAGVQRFALIGFSQGCATAISYAVRHPERVSHLILYAGFARGPFRAGNIEGEQNARAFATLMKNGWQAENPAFRQIFATRMLPDMTPQQAQHFDRLLKETCTGELAERYQLAVGDVDIRDLLPKVTAPTLVLHVRDDAMVPLAGGRALAAGISGAQFISISGRNHVPLPGEPTADRLFEEIDRFLARDIMEQPPLTGATSHAKQVNNTAEPIRALEVRPAEREANSPVGSGSILLDPAKPPVLPSKPSIAVLPFQNMSGDPEQDYFADGMVEDIITALSRFRSLFVIARNSSFAYKDRAVDIRQVGRELGVRYVLEGSVRKAGGRVRITSQLVEAATGSHLWADKFDGTLEDVFELQDTVAAGVVSQIVPQLILADADQLIRKSSESWGSHDRYLRGLALVHRRTIETNKQAQAEFEAAIRLDPNFALPYVQAAFCVHNRYWNYLQRYSEDERTEAIRLTTHALELAPNDDAVLGLAAYIIGNMNDEVERGVALADRSLHLNPNLLQAWAIKGYLSVLVGDLVDAREALDQAIRLSPLDKVSVVGALRGHLTASLVTGEDQAAWAKKLLALNPTDVHGLLRLYDAALLAGATEEASNTHRRILELYPDLRKPLLREMYLRYRRPEHQAMAQAFLNRIDIPE